MFNSKRSVLPKNRIEKIELAAIHPNSIASLVLHKHLFRKVVVNNQTIIMVGNQYLAIGRMP
jgi:hypothetical protein